MKSRLLAIIALSIGISGCSGPRVERIDDLTGDGISDVLIKNSSFTPSENGYYLCIGQKDGSFVTAKQHKEDGLEYYKTKDKIYYFFDGKHFVESKKYADERELKVEGENNNEK